MQWFWTASYWYIILFLLGIIFYPMTRLLFARFVDHGYPFAKTIGILIVSYAAYLLGSLKLVPFTRVSLLVIIGIFAVINYLIHKKNRKKPEKYTPRLFICVEELLFFVSLLFLTFIRGQEPSLNSLEKFMDFGFMNSILRSTHFPPLDMWYSSDPISPGGYPINYYYFGHLTGSVLIKLANVLPAVGYNLILASIFAQGMTLAFSITINVISLYHEAVSKIPLKKYLLVVYGLIGAYLVNLAGNLHTIYLFTKGYPNENPVPFWNILSTYNPTAYWYPNATRFIPLTIHEFPSYSYVVADLHGHVFNIPFVLLIIALLVMFFIGAKTPENPSVPKGDLTFKNLKLLITKYRLLHAVLLGFLIAVHYMTNAFDGPIYFLLTVQLAFLIFGLGRKFFFFCGTLLASFLVFSLPFTSFFAPFVSGIGVNCAHPALIKLQKVGPFLFEKDKCQVSPLWMLFVLWGFFITGAIILAILNFLKERGSKKPPAAAAQALDAFFGTVFAFGLFLILIPEFFYVKDIYPAHFRANTMFKMGYQAFILMGIGCVFVLYRLRHLRSKKIVFFLKIPFLVLTLLVFLYPFFSFPSYYGDLNKKVDLDGSSWLKKYPEDLEIITYLNESVSGQPVILEAQGDSYTEYERISAYTGLPTVAGWWVHEWLWRGSADVVGKRIPDVVSAYESPDIEETRHILKKYNVRYVIVSRLEREKYKKLREKKFEEIGRKIFESSNGFGALYSTD